MAPFNREAALKSAEKALRQGRIDAAIAEYVRVVEAQPRDLNSANALGDPRVALAWLVNELSGLGMPLDAGQVVTTGTCVVPVPVVPGDEVRASFGAFGNLTVRFSP